MSLSTAKLAAMIVCPLCQFHNPRTNKYCQRCGTPMVAQAEPELETETLLNSYIHNLEIVPQGTARQLKDEPDPPYPVSLMPDWTADDSAPTKLLPGLSRLGGSEGNTPTQLLPNQLAILEAAARTDVGRQRDHNEDYFFSQTHLNERSSPLGRQYQAQGLYILCDGMGGHANGEVASSFAATLIADTFQANGFQELPDDDQLLEAIYQANQAIYEINEQETCAGNGRMGTTLVVVLVQDTQVKVAHVGDSRLYRLTRTQGLEQLTVDHVVATREIQRGIASAVAYERADAYQLTQALGPRHAELLKPVVQTFTVEEDTLLILGSDGLTDMDLLEQHWLTHLDPLLESTANLEEGMDRLVQLANDRNGHDNITVVAVRMRLKLKPAQSQGPQSHS
jgi:protein phosphatase